MPRELLHDEPPLGPLPDLEAAQRGGQLEALDIPYTSASENPRTVPMLDLLTGFVNARYHAFDLEPPIIDPESIHILSPPNYASLIELTGRTGNAGGVYHRFTDTVYAREPTGFGVKEDLLLRYAVAHEIGHKLTYGAVRHIRPEDNAFILGEALADRFAGDYIHQRELPVLHPSVTNAITRLFTSEQQPEFQGARVTPQELLYVDGWPGGAVGLSRIAEMRTLARVQELMGSEASAELLRTAHTCEDVRPLKHLVEEHAGIEAWRSLTITATV